MDKIKCVIIGNDSYLFRGFSDNRENVDFFYMSFNDWHTDENLEILLKADAVINFTISPDFSIREINSDEIIDIQIAKKLKDAKCRFLFISSRKVYGISQECKTYKEDNALKGFDFYSKNKIKTEKELACILGKRLCIFRVPDIVGEPILRKNYKTFMGWITENIASNGKLKVTHSKDAQKDFITKDFLHKAFAFFIENKMSGIFNVSAGFSVKVGEILADMAGKDKIIFDDTAVNSDSEQFILDNSKLTALTGLTFTPQDLEQGCAKFNESLNKICQSKSGIKTVKKKIAVFFHLYYEQQLNDFLDLFKNLSGFDYDLFVTLVNENRVTINRIKEFKENSKIYICENRGYDVGPFFYLLNKVNLDDYEYIIKLHAKNLFSKIKTVINGYPLNDRQFSGALTRDLLGTSRQIKQNLKILDKNDGIGMLGSSLCVTDEKFYYDRFLDKINEILLSLNLKHVKNVRFTAGTMFIAKAECFKILQNKIDISCFDKTDGNIKDGTLAHVYERVFGAIIQGQNYKLKGTGLEKIKYVLKKANRLFYRKRISRRGNFTGQILFLPVYRKSLLSHDEKLLLKSALFDTYWYLDKYLKDQRRRYFPVRHYLRIGWKKGFDPSENFSTNDYLRANLDAANVKINPLLHWLGNPEAFRHCGLDPQSKQRDPESSSG
ncbi:MAG: NAD-dependent epimerase/dehydratase family protein [Endomicrobia bacterium]|nr:NAD-dependent epimerase/dehydratase family protein [Endomicrobiia bacterium]MCL2506651.1 NAD-dependent epimerase/dehydratase family protein [Endomicrobiia bacterium]